MRYNKEQAKSLFLSAVMILSVVAIGGIGFAGSAAADATTNSAATNGNSPGASAGETVTYENITAQNGQWGFPTNFTAVQVTPSNLDNYDIENITIKNASTGEFLGGNDSSTIDETGTTNVSFNQPVSNSSYISPFTYDVEITFNSSTQLPANGTSLSALNVQTFNATANTGNGNTDVTTIAGGADTINNGNVSVNGFNQQNANERTNLNLSVTTPADSANGVNESTITVALNNSDTGLNKTNLTVIKNGDLTSIAQANESSLSGTSLVGPDDDSSNNVTYDIDVELPEFAEGIGYNVTLLSNIKDSAGNTIKDKQGGSLNITSNGPSGADPSGAVKMYSSSLRVTADDNTFTNPDGSSPAAQDENATINVSFVDKFGNTLDRQGNRNGSVTLSTPSDVSQTNVTANAADQLPVPNPSTERADSRMGLRGTPIQFNVTSRATGDKTIQAFSSGTDSGGSATQTFVGSIGGVTLSTNKTSSFVADGVSNTKLTAQLVDSNGNPVAVPDVTVDFFGTNLGASGADGTISPRTNTTNSNGVATALLSAQTAGETTDLQAVEQETNNNNPSNTVTLNTTAGDISASSSQLFINGSSVSGYNQDIVSTGVNDFTTSVGSQKTLSVKLVDTSNNNNPVQGQTVEFSVGNNVKATNTTISNGYANATVSLPTTKFNGSINVTAGGFNASSGSAGDAQVNVTTNATAPTTLQFKDDARSLPVDSSGTVDIQAVDQYGNVNVSNTTDVKLISSDTSVFDFPSGNGAYSSAQTIDSTNGEPSFSVNATASAGSATLQAITNNSITNVSDTFSSAEPASINLTVSNDVSTGSSAAQTAQLEAQLLGPNGESISINNEAISFARTTGDAAELNASPAEQLNGEFEDKSNATGFTDYGINASDSTTGDTTFVAQTENYSASGSATVTTTGAASGIAVTTNVSTVPQNGKVKISASFTDGSNTVPRAGTISLSSDKGGEFTTTKPSTTVSDPVATSVYNASGQTGTVTIQGIGGGVAGSTTVSVNSTGSGGSGFTPGTPPATYDTDNDGSITASELGGAVNAYSSGSLSASELGQVVTAYSSS